MATNPAVPLFTTFEAAAQAIGMTPYPEQVLVASRIAETHDKQKIGLIEAPTGTGKTLAIAHSAINLAVQQEKTIGVAVPTITLIHQIADEIKRLAPVMAGANKLTIGMVLGRGEFLSPAKLSNLLEDLNKDGNEKERQIIEEWIAAGAPGRTKRHPNWTRDGLESLLEKAESKLPIDASTLQLGVSDKGSPAWQVYEDQFAGNPDILIVTHAMLSLDLLKRFVATSRKRRAQGMQVGTGLSSDERWLAANVQRLEIETGDEGRLPDYKHLIIDEAHLLREIMESSMSTAISVKSLTRNLTRLSQQPGRLVPKMAAREMQKLETELISRGKASEGKDELVLWDGKDPNGDIVNRIGVILENIKFNKTSPDLENEITEVRRAFYGIQEATRAKGAVQTMITWSPTRKYPSITVGRKSLRSELDFMWGRLEGASLVSATLYTENAGGPSPDYTAGRLSIPESRRLSYTPIQADWLRNPVKAFLPGKTKAELLNSQYDKIRRARLAEEVESIAQEGRGILVLCTSHEDSEDISRILRKTLNDRVIGGTRERITVLKERFLQAAKDGKRPVWVSQGPAWTGLDLPDWALDTLVIARLPYPRPRMGRDGENVYSSAHIAQMLMTFKQGVGRLVRTRKATSKRLYVIDGRIVMVQNARGALALMKTYNPQEF